MERPWTAVLPWVTAFAVAMGFLESAVVVYLREAYYPSGFAFPLAVIDLRVALTELVREACTLIMLLAPGALLSRRRGVRFAWFCYCFGVWDLVYYLFLKVILGWPADLGTWDVLFLLPVVWVGPVWAPCLISVGLIAIGVLWLRREGPVHIPRWVWAVASVGALVMLWTFIEGPLRHLTAASPNTASTWAASGTGATLQRLADYVPGHFVTPVFLAGAALAAVLPLALSRRN